jgi:ERCC4-related helicase
MGTMTDLVGEYKRWVTRVMGEEFVPHSWQQQLALDSTCTDRLIRIPTGFGKTPLVRVSLKSVTLANVGRYVS